MNNKDNLLEVSLELFSQRGFSGVSVRDICGELNLKESALYYHFKNKEAILNALYARVEALIDMMQASFVVAFAGVSNVSTQAMQGVAKNFLLQYYCDQNVRRLLAMLNIERMRDPVAAEKFSNLMYDCPLKQCETVFTQMVARGIVRELDSGLLAREYLGVIVMAFDRFVLGNDQMAQGIEMALEEIDRMIGLFYESIRK